MKLINCPACNHAVSYEANKCPACGQPLRRWARGLYAIKLVAAVIFVLLAIWLLASGWRERQRSIEGPVHISTGHGD